MRRASSTKRSPTSSVVSARWRAIFIHSACNCAGVGIAAAIRPRSGGDVAAFGSWPDDRFRRGALGSLRIDRLVHIGHSTKPRPSCSSKSSVDPNQPSKRWSCSHARLNTFIDRFPRLIVRAFALIESQQPTGMDEPTGIGCRRASPSMLRP
jgi:hypothetical protein